MSAANESMELPGLSVVVDQLIHQHGGPRTPPGTPHIFAYFLTIRNDSDRRVKFLGRKWVVAAADGGRQIIEGDKIVGEEPDLAPGERFSYNSFHLTAGDASAEGSFHGLDEKGNRVHVRIPTFELSVPRS